ncbi:hypothetical protein HN51_070669 [Arachis hypogaea]
MVYFNAGVETIAEANRWFASATNQRQFHGLLEVEGVLVGSSQTEKILFYVDKRFLYEKYESEFEEGEGVLNPQQMEEEDFFSHIVWAPRI